MIVTIKTPKGFWVRAVQSLGLTDVRSTKVLEAPDHALSVPPSPPTAFEAQHVGNPTEGFPFRELSESVALGAVLSSGPQPSRSEARVHAAHTAESFIEAGVQDLFESETILVANGESAGGGVCPLARKSVQVIGFEAGEIQSLSDAFAQFSATVAPVAVAEGSQPWDLLQLGDALIMRTPPDWELIEPLRPGFLSQYRKPALLAGSASVLLRLAQTEQPGKRDYVMASATVEDFVWRTQLLMASPAAPPAIRSRNRRPVPEVLIVDEDATARSLIASVLERYGMVCHQAEQGRAAMDSILTSVPDAVVSEVSLSGMDGFQLLASIKQDPALSEVSVLLLTGRASEADKLQAFALGVDDFLAKPFSPMELAARIRRLLKRRR